MRSAWRAAKIGFRRSVRSPAGVTANLLRAVAMSIAVATLLLAGSVPHALQERGDRVVSANSAHSQGRGTSPLSNSTRTVGVSMLTDWFGDQSINGFTLYDASPGDPLPAGISKPPAPGEMYVSPAMLDLLEGPDAELLTQRYPQRIAGVIAKPGVVDPGDLVVYAGAHRAADQSVDWYTRFGDPHESAAYAPLNWTLTLTVLAMLVAVFIAPPLACIALSTRLAAPQRTERIATLRLLGVRRSSLRWFVAGESLPGTLIGAIGGLALFFLGREIVGGWRVLGLAVYADDLTPGIFGIAAIVLGGIALAVSAAALGARSAMTDPLASRMGRVSPPRKGWRLATAGLSIVLLVVAQLGARLLAVGGKTELAVRTIPLLLCLISLPLVFPILIDYVARLVREPRTPATVLAARRIQGDAVGHSSAASVLGVGVLAIILLLGVIAAGRSSAVSATTHAIASPAFDAAPPGGGPSTSLSAARETASAIEGVRNASVSLSIMLDGPGADRTSAIVADCAVLARQLGVPCKPGDAFAAANIDGQAFATGTSYSVLQSGADGTVKPSSLDIVIPAMSRVSDDEPSRNMLFFTPEATGIAVDELATVGQSSVAASIVLEYDGDWRTLERVRDTLAPSGLMVTAESWQSPPDETFTALRAIAVAIAIIVALQAAVSLVAAGADYLAQRRATLAHLAAIGVRRSVLMRSMALSTAIPAVGAILLAAGSGVVLTLITRKLGGDGMGRAYSFVIPGESLILVLVGAICVVALACVALVPATREACRADRLRVE